MPQIVLATLIRAAPAVCFDGARDAQLHMESARQTGERIVAGRDSGLWELGDEITFEGVHLGVRQRFSARIVDFERPHFFRDEMTRGAFASLSHTHIFQALPDVATAGARRWENRALCLAMVSSRRTCADFCVSARGI